MQNHSEPFVALVAKLCYATLPVQYPRNCFLVKFKVINIFYIIRKIQGKATIGYTVKILQNLFMPGIYCKGVHDVVT